MPPYRCIRTFPKVREINGSLLKKITFLYAITKKQFLTLQFHHNVRVFLNIDDIYHYIDIIYKYIDPFERILLG